MRSGIAPDAVEAVRAGERAPTLLQPVAIFAEQGVRQADSFIRKAETRADAEKPLFDCLLITSENRDAYSLSFVLDP